MRHTWSNYIVLALAVLVFIAGCLSRTAPDVVTSKSPTSSATYLDESSFITTDVDYERLRNLLAAGKWKEADEETKAVMLKISQREEEGWIDAPAIYDLPCEDFRTINNLWVKYSQKKFGFSAQQPLWLRIEESLKKNEDLAEEDIYIEFAKQVGWHGKKYQELTFTLDAPQGQFPAFVWDWWTNLQGEDIEDRVIHGEEGGWNHLLHKLESCTALVTSTSSVATKSQAKRLINPNFSTAPAKDPVTGEPRKLYIPTKGKGCMCPYDFNVQGERCGRTSEYSKKNGAEPVCYVEQYARQLWSSGK